MNQEILLILRELRSDVKLVELGSNTTHSLCRIIIKNTKCNDIMCENCFLMATADSVDKALEELCEPRITTNTKRT